MFCAACTRWGGGGSSRNFDTRRVHCCPLFSPLQAVDAHLDSIAAAAATSASSLAERPAAPAPASAPATPRRRSSRSSSSAPIAVAPLVSTASTVLLAKPSMSADEFATAADALDARVLDNFALRFARRKPRTYLWIIGHLLVWIEIVAVLTPLVAMGMQVRSRSAFVLLFFRSPLVSPRPITRFFHTFLFSSFAVGDCIVRRTASGCLPQPRSGNVSLRERRAV